MSHAYTRCRAAFDLDYRCVTHTICKPQVPVYSVHVTGVTLNFRQCVSLTTEERVCTCIGQTQARGDNFSFGVGAKMLICRYVNDYVDRLT